MRTKHLFLSIILVLFLVAFTSAAVFAQGSSTIIISGTVWNDINADTLKGDAANNILGTNILTQVDTSQPPPNPNTYGDPTVPDAGVEQGYPGIDVHISYTSQGDTYTADVVTDANGAYSFDIPNGSKNVVITFEAPTGYKFSSDDPAGDNDADQQVAAPVPPALWTADIAFSGPVTADITDGTDAGLRPVPQIVLDFFDTNGLPDGVQGIITGTPEFNTHGACQTAAPYENPLDGFLNADTVFTHPGDDCHKYDLTVRTNDTVSFVPAITVDSAPSGGIDNIILEMQFYPNDGAVLTIDSPLISGIPQGCETGSAYSPTSEVIQNIDGSLTVICNIGTVENGQEFRVISVKPTGASPNGSSFTTEFRSYAAGNDAIPSNEPPAPDIMISALPEYDLTKNSYNPAAGADGGSPRNGVWIYAGQYRLNTVTGEYENGVRVVYEISIMVDGDGKGTSELGDTFSFEEYIDPRYAAFGARIEYCRSYPWAGSSGLPWNGFGALPYEDNRTIDNGAITCALDGSSNTLTITNADTSGAHYPSEGYGGASTAPHKIVVTGTVIVWYPYSAFYRSAGPDKTFGTADDGLSTDPDDLALWQYGEAPVTGTYPTLNCLGDFDPDSVDANGDPVSNFGDDFEPGWDGATSSANNCRVSSFTISATGTFSKKYAGAYYLDDNGLLTDRHRFYNAPSYHWACTGAPDRLIVPGQSACSSGDGPIVAMQEFTASVITAASRSAADLMDPISCEAIDNATYQLKALTAPDIPARIQGQYAYYVYKDTTPPSIAAGHDPTTNLGFVYGEDHGWVITYARFNPANTSQVTWQIDHAAGPADPVDGTIPISNPQQQLAAKDCGDALTAAGTLEWTTDPDAAGWDIGDVVMVKSRGPVLQAGDSSTHLHVSFEAREFFYSPDNPVEDGLPIPLGTLLPNVANAGYDKDGDGVTTFSTDPAHNDYHTGGYDATNHAGLDGTSTVAYGDRLIFQTVNIAIDKESYRFWDGSSAGDDDTTQVNVGDPIMWSLHPSVNSINDLAFARDVVITDVLPEYVYYAPGCTPATPAGVSGPVVIPNTPNAGETTLIWTYDNDVPANVALEPISFCTNTDAFAPANPTLDVINEVKIEASNVAYAYRPHTDERLVTLVQIGRFAVQKDVDFPLDFQDQEQVWTMTWANTSDTFPFNPPDVIDVFPWVGDGPGSLSERETYASDFAGTLELQAIPDLPQVENGVGTFRADNGQWYATCDAAATVNADPLAASNDLVTGSTEWIAVTASSTSDPSGTCALAAVTAIRWVSTDTLLALDTARVPFTLQADLNAPNDIYVNRFIAYSPSFTDPVRSNEPFVQVIGFSIGDLIWLDVNENDVFDAGTDITAPAGTIVNLYDDTDTLVGTTTTDADGRWFFEALAGDQYGGGAGSYVAGSYYVTVDTAQFPTGWGVGSDPVLDPNTDLNEAIDHHAVASTGTLIRSSGLMVLSASVDGVGEITGDEPGGDNIKFLGDPLIRDDLTNFTLDLMLEPDRGDISLQKVLVGDDTPLVGWQFTITSDTPDECPLPTALVNPAVTDALGQASFIGLIEYNPTTGEKCQYSITETFLFTGWRNSNISPAGPYEVDAAAPLEIEVENTRNLSDLQVTKTVSRVSDDLDWSFAFTLTPTATAIVGQESPITGTGPGSDTAAWSGLIPGESYTLTETIVPGYLAGALTCTGVTDTDGDLTDQSVTFVAPLGDANDPAITFEVVCEVTNTGNTSDLQVTKTVSGVSTDVDWSFEFTLIPTGTLITNPAPIAGQESPLTGTGPGSDTAAWSGLIPGESYTLTETTVPGYAAGALTCTGVTDTDGDLTDQSVTFVAPLGDANDPAITFEVVCAITNTGNTSDLQVTKTVSGVSTDLDWSFAFTLTPTATVGEASPATGTGPGSATVSWTELVPGTEYILSETTVAGYAAGALTCTGVTDTDGDLTDQSVTFVAPLGDANDPTITFEVVCAVTNTGNTSDLQVTKTVSGVSADVDWSFEFTLTPTATVGEASPATGTGPGSDTVSWTELVPGTEYILSETTVAGYAAGALTCTGVTDTDGDLTDQSVTFVAPLGDANDPAITFEVVCAIENTDLGSIGDYVWVDVNGDGVQDAGEIGIPGATVTLTPPADVDLGAGVGVPISMVTDADGLYLFEDLPAGDYTVSVDISTADETALQLTYPDLTLDELAASFDADGGNDSTSALTLAPGEDNLDQDFGYQPLGSIGDYVWVDVNGDGVQDAGEIGIPGATVTLTPPADVDLGAGVGVPISMVTDADGLYLFEDLPAGDYTVSVDVSTADEAALQLTYPDLTLDELAASFDADGGNDSTSALTLAPGEDNLDQDFGYLPLGSIGDYVWVDVDGDGVQDSGEIGIPGATVTLTPPAGVDLGAGVGVPISMVTDADGLYLFEDLPAGDYIVSVDVSTADVATLRLTHPDLRLDELAATFDADGGNDSTSALTLAPGEDNLDQDFGYTFPPLPDLFLPETGFAPGRVTRLPNQPAEKQYSDYGKMVLDISSLGIKLDIVGVPTVNGIWDVTWLNRQAGWLTGSAYPTWAGNTVITAHVWDAYNNPGPFAKLSDLQYGDRFQINVGGKTYTYEVRANSLISPENTNAAFVHEEYDWVTLITCEDYNPRWGTYDYRRMVRAVLVDAN